MGGCLHTGSHPLDCLLPVTSWTIETSDAPDPAELEALSRGLRHYNLSRLGPDAFNNYAEIAVFARAEDGAILGGITGELMWEWLYIRIFWVSEAMRGQGIGSQLLRTIEQAALTRGFRHAHLETTSFQALDFYRKHGYQVFGEINNKPTGHHWYFLQKALD